VDGNDYYLFENLKVRPKVICIEYNFWFGRDAKCSIPYDKNFTWEIGSTYVGASLNSLCELAKRKGYFLVALESHCVNAFFVRSDLIFSTCEIFCFEAYRAFLFAIKKFLAKPLLTSIISPIEPIFFTFSNKITFIL